MKIFSKKVSLLLTLGIFTFSIPLNIAYKTSYAYAEQNNFNTDKFKNDLVNTFENQLKKELKRRKIAFDADITNNGDNINISVPSYILRETVFEVSIINDKNNKKTIIKGKVLNQEQKDLLETLLNKYSNNKIENNLDIFPYHDISKPYAVIKKSYANMFVKPGDKDLATQLLIGTPLKVLEISADKKFARVQSYDDKYISWVSRNDINEFNKKDFDIWVNKRNSVIIKTFNKSGLTLYFGTVLPVIKKNNNVSDVILPTGKTLSISNDYFSSFENIKNQVSGLVKNANNYLELGKNGQTTYLWGGTVGNNLDCSGFNQTIFRAEGIFLPRDADQQQNFTLPVANNISEIDNLKPGDLLFFSENRQYATHTGVYIGNGKFIHSSKGGGYGGIKINSLKGGEDYDKHLQKIYFGGGRLTHIGTN